MRAILVASLTFALGGCLSVPVAPTAANDDACLRNSVGHSITGSKCESLRTTWGRIRSDYHNPGQGAGGGEVASNN